MIVFYAKKNKKSSNNFIRTKFFVALLLKRQIASLECDIRGVKELI